LADVELCFGDAVIAQRPLAVLIQTHIPLLFAGTALTVVNRTPIKKPTSKRSVFYTSPKLMHVFYVLIALRNKQRN
jgi:hypothetical protein